MTSKLKLDKIVETMKQAAKEAKKSPNPLEKTHMKPVSPGHRERDMRDEAKELGSYGAHEYFGESKT